MHIEMAWMMALGYRVLPKAKMENIMDMHVQFADIKIIRKFKLICEYSNNK